MYFERIINRYKEEIDIVNELLKKWYQFRGILSPIIILGLFTKFEFMFTSFTGIAYSIVIINILIVTYFIFINMLTVNLFIKKYNKKFNANIKKLSYFAFIESFINRFFFTTERTQDSVQKINDGQMEPIRKIVDKKQIELMRKFLKEERINNTEKIQIIQSKIKRWKIRDFIEPSSIIGAIIGLIPLANMDLKTIFILITVVGFVIGFFYWEYHYTLKKQFQFYTTIVSPFKGLRGLSRMEDLLLYFIIHDEKKQRSKKELVNNQLEIVSE